MAVALEIYEAGLHACGHPTDWVFNEDSEGHYVAKDVVCQACAARERHMRENADSRKPGQFTAVFNTMKPGTRLDPRMAPSLPTEGDSAAQQDGPQQAE